jgi:(p)ppGpp synthase/HD superfamily hydrolase
MELKNDEIFFTLKQKLEQELQTAIQIATKAHKGQKRHGGEPFITHPNAVANNFFSLSYQIVSWLHDVIEDTSYTLEQLYIEGISSMHIERIDILTQKDNQTYYEYIQFIKNSRNKMAIAIKIADTQHNMLTCTKTAMNKYLFALDVLKKVLSEL